MSLCNDDDALRAASGGFSNLLSGSAGKSSTIESLITFKPQRMAVCPRYAMGSILTYRAVTGSMNSASAFSSLRLVLPTNAAPLSTSM